MNNSDDKYEKYFLDYLKNNAKKLSYSIKDTQISDDTATVKVDVKYIDGTPLIKDTISEYLTQAFSSVMSGSDMSDEEMSQMLLSIMQEKQKTLTDSYVEKTLAVKCVKVNGNWYIEEVTDDLLNVVSSNFYSLAKSISDSFNSGLE